ncbi:MAG: M3 family metallopeptidase, partial [Planctomycetota bacterium]
TDAFADDLAGLKADLERSAETVSGLPQIAADGEAADEWSSFLRDYADVTARYRQTYSLVGCYAAGDAGNAAYQKAEGRLAALRPLAEAVASAIETAVRDVPEETLTAFLSGDAYLNEVAFLLIDAKSLAALRLPPAEESLANELAVDGLHAWGRLYDRVSGELQVEVMTADGPAKKSVGQVTWTGPERTVREQNFYAADRAWASVGQTCADCLNHISGARLTRYGRLGFDHLEEPLRRNRIGRETLDALLGTVADKTDVLVPYLKRKAELLGVDRLAWYDQSAPLPTSGRPRPKLSYEDACDKILNAFGRFAPDFADFAAHALKSGWIEAEDREGKRQGGFCTDLPVAGQTRIFMTFTDDDDSMSTLAHELGHAYHTWLLKDRPVFLQDYPMNLAETASTFAEQVLADARLDAADDAEEAVILDGMLSDATAFLMNLPARFRFEDAVYRERADGELAAERLSDLMVAAQKAAYAESLDVWHPRFWAAKL